MTHASANRLGNMTCACHTNIGKYAANMPVHVGETVRTEMFTNCDW